MNYIIVQAGGRGTRLEYLTRNKPKALVPVNNLPMLFHLFRKYQDKHFIIIADYKKEVMKEYLQVFADVKYQIVEARGNGTCAGIKQAIHLLPEKEPFLLIWSDLLLPMDLKLPSGYEDGEYSNPTEDYIGISQSFPCRWSYFAGRFEEKKSYDHGVAGFFLFTDKEKIKAVPENGELVRWMQKSKLKFCEIGLDGTKEFGLLEEYSRLEQNKCRPFNRITIRADRFIKEAVDKHGRKLAKREREWYKKAGELGITALPKIYGTEPLEMELIQGKNIYEYQLSYEEKKKVLKKLVETLQILHSKEQVPADLSACREVYLNKTFYRVDKIRNLLPFANEKYIVVNGKRCRNVFFYKKNIECLIEQMGCEKFSFIHGDCTFSNLMLREDENPVLLDPRGYFGDVRFYGDPRYDWAKLYYSIVGNYDRFNLKEFRLEIRERDVCLDIVSNHWEDMESSFFKMTGTKPGEIKLLHALIWLSLTTYAWQDYDSVCGAFYNGLWYLEDIL